MTWLTSDVVCARWGSKNGSSEPPLAMYQYQRKEQKKNRKTNEFPEPRVDNVKTEKLHKKSLKDAEGFDREEERRTSQIATTCQDRGEWETITPRHATRGAEFHHEDVNFKSACRREMEITTTCVFITNHKNCSK